VIKETLYTYFIFFATPKERKEGNKHGCYWSRLLPCRRLQRQQKKTQQKHNDRLMSRVCVRAFFLHLAKNGALNQPTKLQTAMKETKTKKNERFSTR
jgi:hypothetical protein